MRGPTPAERWLLALGTLALASACGTSSSDLVEPDPGVEIQVDSAGPAEPAPSGPRDGAATQPPARATAPAPGPSTAVEPAAVDVEAEIDRQDAAVHAGRGEEALARALEHVDAGPEDPDRHYLAGRILGLLRRPADARAAFERALLLEPEHAWSLHGIGVLELRDGRPEVARGAFEKALALDPENARFAVALAGLEYERARAVEPGEERRSRLERARALLLGAESRSPGDARLDISLALVLVELGGRDEAIARAARAALRSPRDPAVLLSQGQILEAADRLEEAIQAYGAVLATASSGQEVEYARARLERLEEVVKTNGRARISTATRQAELARYLEDPEPATRREAYKRLRELAQPGDAPIFLRGLGDADRNVRVHSIWALGELGVREAVPQLLRALREDPDELARGAVGKALVDLQGEEAIGPLVEALAVEESRYVIEQIDFALQALSGDDPLAGTSDARRRIYSSPDGRERLHSAWAEWWSRREER